MTRMIERWFPCAEVSEATMSGWGLGRAEKGVFPWYAARPPAQARAALLTSVLPWPDDPDEQDRLQSVVRRALMGRFEGWAEVQREMRKRGASDIETLDTFSGRGIIPLESARFGVRSSALDYSPMAVLASRLLTEFMFRDWDSEPGVRFGGSGMSSTLPLTGSDKLLNDLETLLVEVGRRHQNLMLPFFGDSAESNQVWGYLWARTLPCQECGRRFPLIGTYELRRARNRASGAESAVSYFIDIDKGAGTFRPVVHEGAPRHEPTFRQAGRGRGRSAVCPFCDYVHPIAVHQRLSSEGLGEDELLVVAELASTGGKTYRTATDREKSAAAAATEALEREPEFRPGLPAVPNEKIPENNGATIRPALYGACTYGDLMCDRQTLSFVRLARIIDALFHELCEDQGLSDQYARALVMYVSAVVARKIRYSTRGATLYVRNQQVSDIYLNEATISFSYDFFEVGLGRGAGSWSSLTRNALSTLRTVAPQNPGQATSVERGSATALPYRSGRFSAVVTDPPYDAMVYYTDASDLSFSWLKRVLHSAEPTFGMTSDPRGIQEKADEIIVKDHGKAPGEHRDREHYDTRIKVAFSEMRRVVDDDGIVTIVFGHGEPEVWKRLLGAIQEAGLVMTGSWPARTEAGGQQGKANIETTLTMACRPAALDRPEGRRAAVESAVKKEVRDRITLWTESGLAPTDMLMASAGPAMEVVGRYSRVLDAKGDAVDIDVFLPIARQAVQEADALEIDHHPLETFDARTRFALWWVRLFGRQQTAKSELRWQALASSLDLVEVRDLVPDAKKGCAFVEARAYTRHVGPESAVIDVALRMAQRWPDGLDAVAEVLIDTGRHAEDAYLWAAISFLADRLPDSDADAIAWTGILRNRKNIGSAARGVIIRKAEAADEERQRRSQGMLFDVDTEMDEVQA